MRVIPFYVALGGGIGAVARFAIEGWAATGPGGILPWGTLAVNLIGSALLGVLVGLFGRVPFSPQTRALLTAGFCGGLTTFSTFSLQVFTLFNSGRYLAGAVYAGGSFGVCVLGVALGQSMAPGPRAGLQVPRTPPI